MSNDVNSDDLPEDEIPEMMINAIQNLIDNGKGNYAMNQNIIRKFKKGRPLSEEESNYLTATLG